jgi:hypothetical protein
VLRNKSVVSLRETLEKFTYGLQIGYFTKQIYANFYELEVFQVRWIVIVSGFFIISLWETAGAALKV